MKKSVIIGLIGPICVLLLSLLSAGNCSAQKADRKIQELYDRLARMKDEYKVSEAYWLADSILGHMKNIDNRLKAKCSLVICDSAYHLSRYDADQSDRMFVRAMGLAKEAASYNDLLEEASNYMDFCYTEGRYLEGVAVGDEVADIVDAKEGLSRFPLANFYISRGDISNKIGNVQAALGDYYKAVSTADTLQSCMSLAMSACFKIVCAIYNAGLDRNELNYYNTLYTSIYLLSKATADSATSVSITLKYYMCETQYHRYINDFAGAIEAWDSTVVAYRRFIDYKLRNNPFTKLRKLGSIKAWDYSERVGLLSEWGGHDSDIDAITQDVLSTMQDQVSDYMTDLYYNLGYYYLRRGDVAMSRRLSHLGYATCQKMDHGETQLLYNLLVSLLTCDIVSSDYSDKDRLVKEIDDLRARIFNSDTNAQGLELANLKGWAGYFSGDRSALETNFSKSARILESLLKFNFGYLNAEEFADFWSRYKTSCSQILLAALLEGDGMTDEFAKLVYKTQLGQKNLVFISQNRVKKVARLSPELARDYEELVKLKRRLSDPDPMSDLDRAKYYSQMKVYEDEMMKHFDNTVTDILNVDFDRIKQTLKDGEIAVEFTQVYDYPFPVVISHPELETADYVAIVFSNKSAAPQIFRIFTRAELNGFVLNNGQKLSDVLSQRLPDGVKALYTDKNFTDFVWKKVLSKFQDVKKIYFSPTGALYSIALESLSCGDNLTMSDVYKMERVSSTANVLARYKDFNFDNVSLFGGINYDDDLETQQSIAKHYVGSNEFLQRFCQRVHTAAMNANRALSEDTLVRRNANGLFIPLSSTFEECDYVVRMCPDKKVNFVYGDSAVEESFKYYANTKPYIIHIASHGYFDPDSASAYDMLDRTGLVFAGVNNYLADKHIPRNVDDGFLTSAEISELDLSDTRLAVLSACETGLGIVNSDGLFGLERGFKLAGVESVLMSLWSISDEATSLFMRKFYGALIKGSSPREALHLAQEYLRTGNRFSHPYYWAGFVLVD